MTGPACVISVDFIVICGKDNKNVAHNQHFSKKKVAYRLQFVSVHVAVVAVLQFQNRLYGSQKLTLYLYINIEVFLGCGNSFSRTATLQQPQQWEQSHCNATLWPSGQRSLLELCRAPAVVDEVNTAMLRAKNYRRKMKNFLWSIREPQSLFLTFAVSNWRSGQAVFKGKNCEG